MTSMNPEAALLEVLVFERKAQPSKSHVSVFTTGQRNKVPYRENKVRDTGSALKVEVGFAILN